MASITISMSASTLGGTQHHHLSTQSFQRSLCGEEFDDYIFRAIREPFPFSPVGAASRELPEFWKGRRCRIHYHGKWREAKVCSWTQYNAIASDMTTSWLLEVELDTMEAGDEVEVKLTGTVCNDSKQDGAVTLTTNNADSNDIIIKPDSSSMKLRPRMKLDVNRVNVRAGGTVKLRADGASAQSEQSTLLSLEWLEPPSLLINLNEGILTFDCPCCRKVEPVMKAFDRNPATVTRECPVCLETAECRTLVCGHGVCHGCWRSVRNAAMRSSVELGEIDETEMYKERAERNRLFARKRSRDDSSSDQYPFRFLDMAHATRDNERQGLESFRWELMVENPARWSAPEVAGLFDELSTDGLKVLLSVIEARKDEIQGVPDSLVFMCAFLIAKAYNDSRNYRAGVPWAEVSLYHAQHSQVADRSANLRGAYAFASTTQAKADLFTKSIASFNSSLELSDNVDMREAQNVRELLGNQLKQWTGSSGQLTEGI